MTASVTQGAAADHVDVIVVGAGFSGLYAVHKFRDQMGLTVKAFEQGHGVGGTWFWNRYPGARCDFESIYYSYSFSEELQNEWDWKERFSPQPDILEYLNHVADRFDLRRTYSFETRVDSMVWDEPNAIWHVTTDDGRVTTARFIISGAGNLSLPKGIDIPGADSFAGETYLTGRWPHEEIDFTGKRVAVIGTGASGVQLIPRVAPQAAQLTVFQRTPNFASPLGNGPLSAAELTEIRKTYGEMRVESRNKYSGVPYPDPQPSALTVSEEERNEIFERCWNAGGMRMLLSSFADLLFDSKANELACEFIRAKIKSRVKDPETAENLMPTDHAYATKRPPFETQYYETYNRDNVRLVNLRKEPIEAIHEKGIRTANEDFEFDVIILATGFDAMTGPLLKMGIVGRDGATLTEQWADGPHTYLGIAAADFPNLFMITGPLSAVALYNNPLAIEDHVDFASNIIRHALDNDRQVIVPTREAVEYWDEYVRNNLENSLFATSTSWFMGMNVPGKPKASLIFVGGAPEYRQLCADVSENGYRGFAIEAAPVTADAAV